VPGKVQEGHRRSGQRLEERRHRGPRAGNLRRAEGRDELRRLGLRAGQPAAHGRVLRRNREHAAGWQLVPHVAVEVFEPSGHRMESRVLFSSFRPMNLVRARRLIPEIPLALLVLEGYASRIPPAFEGEPIPYEALHPTKADTAEALVRKNHDKNRRVHVWTVNDADDMRRLFGMGVDGIFTDDPALALMVLQEKP